MSLKTIDYELYDRQIRTFGFETTIKLNESSVAIFGLEKGLATEVCKNLVLCGVQKLYLDDSSLVTQEDLVTGYYYTLGEPRNVSLYNQLKVLNKSLELIDFNQSNVIICINKTEDEIIHYNNLARLNHMKFISLQSSNNNGAIFVDAGDNHKVTNITGETYEPLQVFGLDDNLVVKTLGHQFETGDTVKLTNLQGTNLEQFNDREFKIQVVDRTSFKLLANNHEPFTFINGTVIYIDIPIYINHKPFFTNTYDYSHSDCEIISVNSIMGSLVASECIKLITNKYMPISQWFNWSDDDLIFNDQVQEKLASSHFFVVGSGAIGCELLKNLAFLNVNKITITDPDQIEKSNLSRQFLFNSNDIKQFKSEIATKKIMEMKKTINIDFHTEKVSNQNIGFTNKILSDPSITGIFNALDNIEARKFMDEQAFAFNLPLFESGTMGIKGNTQPVIPFLTETYSNSTDPIVEKSYAVCTIKNFPNEIHHTIHWALDQFELFNKIPSNVNLWLKDREITEDNKNDIWLYTTKYHIETIYDCINWAVDMFNDNYYDQILKLLENFPSDTLTKEGTLFWSNGKRCPTPIKLDLSNDQHLDYIRTTTQLWAYTANLEYNLTDNQLIEYVLNPMVKPNESNESYVRQTRSVLFDKDDDTNNHVKWIMLASNLRAQNYKIEPSDFHTTKGISGKIIPAIATTTSIVAGLITIEMIKYLNDPSKISKFKSSFINLALNIFVNAEPIEAKKIKIGNLEFNSWEKFRENKDMTVDQFLTKYNIVFNTNITMIGFGTTLIYADFLNSDKTKLISNCTGLKKFNLTINSDDDELDLPDIYFSLN